MNEESITPDHDDLVRELPTEQELNELKRAANELALFMDEVNSNDITKEIFASVLSDQEKDAARADVETVMDSAPEKTQDVKVLKRQLHVFEQQMKEMRRMIKKRMADQGVPSVMKKEMKRRFNAEQEQINRGIIMLRRMIYKLDHAEKDLARVVATAV